MSKAPKPDTRAQLLRVNFTPAGPQSSALSDPLEPTPMVLTLDQLRPYELNPRQKQNPKYEEIKESIRARGLDDTPTVSRRPGETDYIIDNGGNTRLKILNDLWKETRDERFYRIHCLFRPWVGDIKALTGHMSENDMRGSLLWIERCLGVSKTRELYEQQEGRSVSQAELARKLKLDGYPVDRTLINRMDQTIQYLFPCIPNILWNGMGRDAVRILLNLRTHAEAAWAKLVAEKGSPTMGVTFEQIFANALQHFDDEPESYVFQHVQDELVGLMTEALRPNGVSYELIMLEMDCSKAPVPDANRAPAESDAQPTSLPRAQSTSTPTIDSKSSPNVGNSEDPPSAQPTQQSGHGEVQPKTTLEPASYADIESLPITIEGPHKIADIWLVYPQYQYPDVLRHQIDLLSIEIALWGGVLEFQRSTQLTNQGLGYRMERPEFFESETAEAVWHVLAALTGEYQDDIPGHVFELALIQMLPDDFLIKLFRLIRLVRYLKGMNAE